MSDHAELALESSLGVSSSSTGYVCQGLSLFFFVGSMLLAVTGRGCESFLCWVLGASWIWIALGPDSKSLNAQSSATAGAAGVENTNKS